MTLFSIILCLILSVDSQVGGKLSPDGSEQIQIDLPAGQHLKNVGGKDGSGLCVFTSVEHSGRWQNVNELTGFQQKMRKEDGGGWPEKLDKMVGKYAPNTAFLQYSGDDPSLLKLALKTGRMPAVTYGYSPRYGGNGRIAHMVNLVHLTDKWAAVLDNNFPGEDKYEWMPTGEFYRRWKLGGGGWAVFLLSPPPPPPPTQRKIFAQVHAPAITPEVVPDEKPVEEFLFGVDQTQVVNKGCFLNGRKITTAAATALIEGIDLTDDSSKLRITLIGLPIDTDPVKRDLEASEWGKLCLIQSYPPNHWATTQIGLNQTGTPRIIVQNPPGADGTALVIHSQGDYAGGIDAVINALRRARPDYDPNKDPDQRKNPLVLGGAGIMQLARVAAVTALIAFFLGWFASTVIPKIFNALKTAYKKAFPPKPNMEEMILNALKKLKEQEAAANVNNTNTTAPN